MKTIIRYVVEAGLFLGIFLLLFFSYAAQREPTNFIYYNF